MGDQDDNVYAHPHRTAGQFAGMAFRHHLGQTVDTTSRELTPTEYADARTEALVSFAAFESYMAGLSNFGGWYSTRPTNVRVAIHAHVKDYDPS